MGINRHHGPLRMIEGATPPPSLTLQGPSRVTGSTRALAQRSRDQRLRREQRLRSSWRERWLIRLGLTAFFVVWFLLFALPVVDYLVTRSGR